VSATSASKIKMLLDELIEVSKTINDDELSDVVREATAEPLTEARARKLYTRILVMLRTVGTDPDEATVARVTEEVRSEVEEAIEANRTLRRQAAPSTDQGVTLVPYNGLEPHELRPIPDFTGKKVAVWEGYIDVTTVDLWKGNHRLDLAVAEFNQREARDPDEDEVLSILQGKTVLPSLAKNANRRDPFDIMPLARSIARKGVERPPILTYWGEPHDGNRRLAAAKYVVSHPKEFSDDERERARWVKVWRCPKNTTKDEIEAIVVSLNFEEDLKRPWPEYIKARLVAEDFERRRSELGRVTTAGLKDIKEAVAARFATDVPKINRYLKMVEWAQDFEQFHVEEKGRDQADVSYRTNDIFQWFYELDAGRGADKLTRKLDLDDDLKSLTYDLMFDVLDSGLQVRTLHKVVDDSDAIAFLERGLRPWHDPTEGDEDERRRKALESVDEALQEAKRKGEKTRKTRVGFDSWLRDAVDRLGATPPDYWQNLDTALLLDLQRVFLSSLGAIEGAIRSQTSGGQLS
jgi:hypothetical protein